MRTTVDPVRGIPDRGRKRDLPPRGPGACASYGKPLPRSYQECGVDSARFDSDDCLREHRRIVHGIAR